ncbi:MFS general substrate transporter [Suhomyces tanzawaensis NRRL Y-17324]|uniref:MFS general substrate transporter n=1 Tax=Suhomyces tanzawaensis NRRL Y-17324 TaxID=984487 RepID=A0A1E4SHC2_9ASCO|nr:MFS general substrate transporter [Suhomyces tanzawaensis NRRL Y-17324]ODV78887.1 MFS general substrate transporter [Suhomyces tanzawaensis NRRL Y-17324]
MVFGIGFSYGVFQDYYTSLEGPLHARSNSQVALVGTIGNALTYTFGIFNKSLMSHFRPRTIMVAGAVLMSLGLALAGSCTHLYQFILTQGVLFGVGASLVYLPPVVCAPIYFNRHRAIAMGVLFSGTGFGGLALASLTRHLLSLLGWRWCLRTLGFANFAVTLGASFLVKPAPDMALVQNNRLFNLHQMGSYRVWLQLLGSLLQSAGYVIPLIYMSKYAQTLGYSHSQGALFIGLNNGINAVFKVVLGFGGDRIGRLNMIVICSVVSAGSIFGLWIVQLRGTFVAFVVMYGVFSGAIISLLPTCLVDIFGVANYQSMTSLMYFVRGIGTMVGSPIAGLLVKGVGDEASDYTRLIIYNGVLLGSSTVCLGGLWMAEYHKRATARL